MADVTRILWISPVGVERSVDDVERILTDAKRPETEVYVTALDRGPRTSSITTTSRSSCPTSRRSDRVRRILRSDQELQGGSGDD